MEEKLKYIAALDQTWETYTEGFEKAKAKNVTNIGKMLMNADNCEVEPIRQLPDEALRLICSLALLSFCEIKIRINNKREME